MVAVEAAAIQISTRTTTHDDNNSSSLILFHLFSLPRAPIVQVKKQQGSFIMFTFQPLYIVW